MLSSAMCQRSIAECAMWIVQLYLWSVLLMTRGGHSAETKNTCQYEMFQARCEADEVVVIKSARYGRMKIGRCVKSDFGFLGCYSDVTKLMDHRCSGQQKCELKVVDPNFENIHPCNPEFKNYLETSYECFKVIKPSRFLCSGEHDVPIVNILPNTGYISNRKDENCGSPELPYVMRLPHGQRLNLSLLDFHLPLSAEVQHAASSFGCDVYATIREPSSGQTKEVCGGQNRKNAVFQSSSNVVEIYMNEKMSDGTRHFLLKYEVLGCADIEPPVHAWVERDGSKATIGCNASQQVWRLICKGNTWVGHVGNCTQAEENKQNEVVLDVMSLPTGMLIAIVIGIACLISFSILLLGIYYLRRIMPCPTLLWCKRGGFHWPKEKRNRRRPRQMSAKTLSGNLSDDYILQTSSGTYSSRDCTSLLPPHRQTCPICARQRDLSNLNACDYAYTWSDSPTSQPRRPKAEKLYSQGIYGPLPCRCIPIKLKDLETRRDGSNVTISTGDSVIRDNTESRIYDVNPDVIRQDSLSRNEPPPPLPQGRDVQQNEQNEHSQIHQQNLQNSLGDLTRTGTSTFKSDNLIDPRSIDREPTYSA